MAKVMISIPDGLLERIDAHTQTVRETRSGFLQRLAEHELGQAERRDSEEIERLLGGLRPFDFGGVSAAQLVREDRDSR